MPGTDPPGTRANKASPGRGKRARNRANRTSAQKSRAEGQRGRMGARLQAGTLHCDVRTGVRRGFVATLQRIPPILPGGCQKVLDSFGWWHYLPKVGQKIMTIVRRQK